MTALAEFVAPEKRLAETYKRRQRAQARLRRQKRGHSALERLARATLMSCPAARLA